MINSILKHLIYLFFLLVPLSPWKFKLHGIPLAVDFVIASMIIITYMLNLLTVKDFKGKINDWKVRIFSGHLWKFIVIYIFVALLSFTKSVNLKASISEFLRFMSYIALIWIIITEVKDKATIINIIKCFTVSALVVAVFGIVQAFTGIGLYSAFNTEYEYGVARRIASTMFNPNNYAAFIVLVSYVFLLIGFYSNKKVKSLMIALFALLSLNLVLTFTRGAWLSFLASAAIMCVVYNKKLLYFLSVPAALIIFVKSIRARFISIFSFTSGANITRLKLWQTGMLMIKDSPVLGVGMGNSIYVYDSYIEKYPWLALSFPKYPLHNSYIKVAAETGILGLLTFILMIGYAVYMVYKIYKNANNVLLKSMSLGFLVSLAGFFIMNLTDDCFFIPQVTVFFWLIFSIIVALHYSTKADI
jgi:Lipid A core - O-antigen ligase and related enzymes